MSDRLGNSQAAVDDKARNYFARAHLAPHHTLPAASTVFITIVILPEATRWCEWFDAGAYGISVYNFAFHQCPNLRPNDSKVRCLLYRNPPGTRPYRSYKALLERIDEAGPTDLTTLQNIDISDSQPKRKLWLDPGIALHKQIGGSQRVTLLLITLDPVQWT
jgi:hypothetical protein